MGRRLTDYQRGLLFTGTGVLCLSPDALLVRLIEVDSWTLLFWRGILMTLGLSLFLLWKRMPLTQLGKKGILAASFLGISTTFFVFSLQQTHAANTLVIVATSPLIAAFLSWIVLRENVPKVTWIAIFVATGGVIGSLADGFGRGHLGGELLALGSAICMASHFVTLRWWKSAFAPLSVWAAGLVIAAMAFPGAHPFDVPRDDLGWLLLLGLVVLPTAFGLMAVGPRYLPAPEVGLLLLGETVLGPLWVWLALEEQPGWATLLGGVVVVTTLALHSLYRRRKGSGP